MTWFAVLLAVGLDVWTVPAGLSDIARAGIPQFISETRGDPIATEDQRAIHLGDGVPCVFLEDADPSEFLVDTDPLRGQTSWHVEFPVLGRHDRVLGSISVMVFTDWRKPKVGGFCWGERVLPEVAETMKGADADRVLGLVRVGSCRQDIWVVYLDKSGERRLKSFASSFDRIRTSDMVVLGKVANIREKALRIAEGADSTTATETRWFDTADIDIERVLDRTGWMGSKIRVCWPHAVNSVMACPPDLRDGDRRVWFLQWEIMAWMERFMVQDAGSAISADYLEQVEGEIAEIRSMRDVPPNEKGAERSRRKRTP